MSSSLCRTLSDRIDAGVDTSLEPGEVDDAGFPKETDRPDLKPAAPARFCNAAYGSVIANLKEMVNDETLKPCFHGIQVGMWHANISESELKSAEVDLVIRLRSGISITAKTAKTIKKTGKTKKE